MQNSFLELVDSLKTPQVFLHGNPHLDNFAHFKHGSGMVDFDRSRIGPYSWDLIRYLTGLSLRLEDPYFSTLPSSILNPFYEAYFYGLTHPQENYNPWKEFQEVKQKNGKKILIIILPLKKNGPRNLPIMK